MSDNILVASSSEASNPFKDAGVCALGAGFLVLFITITVMFGGRPPGIHSGHASLLFAVGGSLPFFVVGVLLISRRSMLTAGAANGLAWATIVISLLLTLVGFLAIIMVIALMGGPLFAVFAFIGDAAGDLHENMPSGGYAILAVLFVVCMLLVRLARIASRTSGDQTDLKQWRSGSRLAWAYAVIGFPLFVQFENAEGERRVVAEQAESSKIGQSAAEVRQALRRVQRCLYAYQIAHPEQGFPAILDSLGSSSRSSNCLGSATTMGALTDAEVRYLPTRTDSGDRIDGFWLSADPTKRARWRNHYYASEDGLSYASELKEIDDSLYAVGRVVTAPVPMPSAFELDVTESPVQSLLAIRTCLNIPRGGITPQRFPAIIEGNRCLEQASFSHRGAQLLMAVTDRNTSTVGGTYSVTYRPRVVPSDTTKAFAFAIEARPTTYGVDGVRSYLLDQDGKVHWTREDRSPTTRDPVVSGCEIDPTAPCPPAQATSSAIHH